MRCEDCRDQLIDHWHDELPADVRLGVALHLAECSDCALAYCRLHADLGGIAHAYNEAPRSEVRDALRRRVEQRFSPSWWRRAWRFAARPVPAYGAALVCMIPVAGWLLSAYAPAQEPGATQTARPAKVTGYDATSTAPNRRGVL